MPAGKQTLPSMQLEQWGASGDTGTLFCTEVMVTPKRTTQSRQLAYVTASVETILAKKPIFLVIVFVPVN
uniref:hypothetical protein n=1 Tax=Orrella sp. TaxID=1921583 RepID=UPI004047EEFD